MRKFIAKLIYHEIFTQRDKFWCYWINAQTLHRWLGEFPIVADVFAWLERHGKLNPALTDEAGFREILRGKYPPKKDKVVMLASLPNQNDGFGMLRCANITRQLEWDTGNQMTLSYRGNELAE